MIYKTQHRKIKIEQHEPHKKPRVNSGASDGCAVPDIMLFLNEILKCVAMVNKETLMKKEMSYKLDVYSG
jgi:hypothetical protein